MNILNILKMRRDGSISISQTCPKMAKIKKQETLPFWYVPKSKQVVAVKRKLDENSGLLVISIPKSLIKERKWKRKLSSFLFLD